MVLNQKMENSMALFFMMNYNLKLRKREESVAANLDNLEFIRMWLVVTQRKEKQDTHDAHGTV